MPYKDPEARREFWRRRNATPKRKAYMRDYAKQRMTAPENREHDNAVKRKRYHKNRERIRAYHSKWRQEHKSEIAKRRRADYAADPVKHRAATQAWRKARPDKSAYLRHKGHAKKRGVQFLMTFEEWWDIWQTSGRWEQRGHFRGQYVMARYGDAGPYVVGNVRICTCSENLAERNRLNPYLGKQRRRHV